MMNPVIRAAASLLLILFSSVGGAPAHGKHSGGASHPNSAQIQEHRHSQEKWNGNGLGSRQNILNYLANWHPRPGQSHEHIPPRNGHSSHPQSSGYSSILTQPGFSYYRSKYERWWKSYQSELQKCGRQPIEPKPSIGRAPGWRVIGGTIARAGSWPWMVSLYSTIITQPWCAGTLVGRQWVMTAAHCFRGPFADPARWTVRVGLQNASATSESAFEQVRAISQLTVHPQYNDTAESFAFDNDIALIKLDKPVLFNDHVSPLCMRKLADHTMEGQPCIITGFGISSKVEPKTEMNILHQASVPLLDTGKCSRLPGYTDKVTRNMLCAGYKDGRVDACFGDSGGPLQCQWNGKWYLAGVTSWGGRDYESCAEAEQPGVYTDVSKYSSWIYTRMFWDFMGYP